MPSNRQIGLPLLIGGGLIFLFSSIDQPPDPVSNNSPQPSAASAQTIERTESPTPDPTQNLTIDLLNSLVITDELREGYERELFMSSWSDLDSDGCDTRKEVLIFESLEPVVIGEDCKVLSGKWISIYDDIETTNPQDLDIDHFVALAEAWDSGAYAWDQATRKSFANDLTDPDSLIAVSRGSNRNKSDLDPTDWLPPLVETHCWYATTWVTIKHRWELSVDASEYAALERILLQC